MSMAGSWAFHCSACGKCCNSAPRLTAPELFAHQARFVGALALRVRQVSGRTPAARAESAALLARLAHPLAGGVLFGEVFTLALAPDGGACPALLAEGRCALHAAGKPLACRVVPLDATLPDAQQTAVLAQRAIGGAEYLGEPCIVPATHAVFPLLVRGQGVETQAARLLAGHRTALAAEMRYWAAALAASLPQAFWQGLAASGETAILPPAPVLLTLASRSPACRQRCVAYADAQIGLLTELGRSSKTETRLPQFLAAMLATRAELQLQRGSATPPSEAVETRLGISESQMDSV